MTKFNWWACCCVIFAVLLLGKSCKSCTDDRRYKYGKAALTEQVDSLKIENDRAMDSINILNLKITALEEQKSIIESNLKAAQTSNQTLINTNNNLSKNKN